MIILTTINTEIEEIFELIHSNSFFFILPIYSTRFELDARNRILFV